MYESIKPQNTLKLVNNTNENRFVGTEVLNSKVWLETLFMVTQHSKVKW